MKIKTSPLENRILLLVVLVLTNPVITIAMNYIAWLQGGTAKYFIMLTHKFKHLIYFHISTYVAVAISQIFWPLLITLSIELLFKIFKKKSLDHPAIYLCFIWIIFNGSFTLLQQGNL